MLQKKISKSLHLFCLILVINSYSQENIFNRSSIKTGIGLGFNDSREETGFGLIYNLGYQKSFGKKEKLRINPNLMIGSFSTNLISDIRDQFYKISSLQMNVSYDIVRYKSFSMVLTTGAFGNYTRGLFGTGGELINNRDSQYFYKLYYGGSLGIGFRLNPAKSRIAYEMKPINFQFGNKGSSLSYMIFGLDIKLKK